MSLAPVPTAAELKAHPVVTREVWLTKRRALLRKEKEATQLLDEVAAARRSLPWISVEDTYVFETEDGAKSLGDLFAGRSQLIIYHFMLGPGWGKGCDGCSFLADHFDGPNLHLPHHDVSLVVVSRAPLAEILTFKKRMGWTFPWVSSYGSAFNYDFQASSTPEAIRSGKILYNHETIDSTDVGEEHHGVSVFFKSDAGEVFQTYSCFARGVDILCGAHQLLDLTPKGRNEQDTMDWVRLHDPYENSGTE